MHGTVSTSFNQPVPQAAAVNSKMKCDCHKAVPERSARLSIPVSRHAFFFPGQVGMMFLISHCAADVDQSRHIDRPLIQSEMEEFLLSYDRINIKPF
jgi:hypothetical protein